MLSLPDYKEKQILIIEAYEGKSIRFKNENLAVYQDEKLLNQVSCYKIFCVFIIGTISITSILLENAAKYGFVLIFMKYNFNVYAVLGAETEGNYLLREQQYKLKDPVPIARNIVANKVKNQQALLQQIRTKNDACKHAIEGMKKVQGNITEAKSLDQLLGFEGTASKIFFKEYFKDLSWKRRMPRTKFDITNVLMDIGYTYLFNFVEAHLRLYGFDVYKGIYHQEFYQRKSLVCDIEEPFRCIIDKQIVKAHNLSQIHEKDFKILNDHYILPYKNASPYTKMFVEAIFEYKTEIFNYVHQFYHSRMNNSDDFPYFYI